MNDLKHLFAQNLSWAKRIRKNNPDFFNHLSKQQRPDYLWVGCSDSRVSANEIVDLPPGEIFVHRNIANVVVHSDLNFLSVLQYAVEVLEVKHIIVCGHYGCGGVKAAMETNEHGLIDNWLEHIRDIVRFHQDKLAAIADKEEQFKRLCELNVVEQVANIYSTTIVKNALKNNKNLTVHGWIYDIHDGIIKNLYVSGGSWGLTNKNHNKQAGGTR